MKTFFKVMFVAILAVAIAAPAMAEIKVNGYLRTIMQADNVDGAGAKDAPTASEVDQRFRAKITNTLTDNVKWVYYGEVDTNWGNAANGATLGADGKQVQTKNVYFSFNVPDTMYSVSLGVQGFSGGFENVVLGHDAAGAKVNVALSDTSSLALQYSKFSEGVATASDDNDFYAATFNNKLANGKLALTLIHLDFDSGFAPVDFLDAEGDGDQVLNSLGAVSTADVYMLGAKFDTDMISAWGIYETGTANEDTANEADIAAYAASVKAKFGDAAVRFTYLSGLDSSDNDWTAFTSDVGGTYQMAGENLMILGTDATYMNLGSTAIAWKVAQISGMMALNATYNTKIGEYYAKLGAGYFLTAEDVIVAGVQTSENEVGMEVAARVGKKVAEKVDVHLAAAYATVGDALATDGDDMFKVGLNVTLPF